MDTFDLTLWFKANNLKPKRIWTYPSYIIAPVFDTDSEKLPDSIRQVFEAVWEWLDENNLKDNKIVLECTVTGFESRAFKNGNVPIIYMSFKDGRYGLGYGGYNKDGAEPKDISHLTEPKVV